MLTSDERLVCAEIDNMRDEIIAFLQDLICAKSFNPPGDTREVANVIANKIGEFGIKPNYVAADSAMPNIIATVNPGFRPNLLYNSHMDTVPVGERSQWNHDPYVGEIIEGKIFGRGASDAKGPLSAMIMAAKAIVNSGIKLNGSLTLNPVADEETGGLKGTDYLLSNNFLDPDMVVVGEITSNEIAIAQKGILWWKVTVIGKTAHASTPWDGVNAISYMVDFLNFLKNELDSRFKCRTHPLTPPPTYNFGVIEGGIKANVVADKCQAIVDRRVLPNETLEEANDELQELMDQFKEMNPDFNASFTIIDQKGYPMEMSPDHKFVQTALDVCTDLGLPSKPVGYQQCSDARFFGNKGIATILIGPGIPATAHTPNEYLGIEDLIEATKVYAVLALRCLT